MDDYIINVPSEQYQKINSETINIYSYQYLGKKLNINNFDLFAISVLIGKCLFDDEDIPNELPKPTETYSRYSYFLNKPSLTLLKSVAIDIEGTIEILNDVPKMIKIWEKYAYVGFKQFSKWYHDSTIDFDSKLDEIILKFYDDYKESYLKINED